MVEQDADGHFVIDGYSLPLPLRMDLPVRVRIRGRWHRASMLPDATVHAMVRAERALVWMEWSPAEVLTGEIEVSLRPTNLPSWLHRHGRPDHGRDPPVFAQ